MKKTKKRDFILLKAKELFGKYGFRRVSVEEICREAGVSKMTFYRYFRNKTELATTVIETMIQKSLLDFRAILYDEIPVEEKLAGILKIKAEGTQDFGEEFIRDLYSGSNPELHEIMINNTISVWNEIIKDFRKAQENGWFRNDFNPELLLHLTFSLIPVMTDPKILAIYDHPNKIIMEIAKLFTYGIAPLSIHK